MINIQLEENNGSEHEIIDEINDYLNTRYLSAMEAAWRIFKYRMASQTPSVTYLPIHLSEEQIILRGNINNNLSSLQCYFLHLLNPEFDNLTYCEYNELYLFNYAEESIDQNSLLPNTYLENKQEGYRQCIVKPYKQGHLHVAQINIVHPCIGEKYYLHILLNHRATRSFEHLQTVKNIEYPTFQQAARALDLLDDITENEQCFTEAVSYNCIPAQLHLLFCHLILKGIAPQTI
ncbi:3925_t:CDS:1 [Scutellospora calospora]|uniref:3925_t:CDS:1 n=1 Tax=Scutellospora calospora TaxID=85575 RepID=A0ACA9K632_9GLOM|nr:3925_t:CDS:1 [Scutellospora calospora]